MRIGIDARALVGQRRGIGNYLYNILLNLKELDQKNEYVLYSHKDFALPFAADRFTKRIGSGVTTAIGTAWLQTQGLKFIRSDNLDVFWGVGSVLPFGLPKDIKKIITVYDLVYLHFSSTMNKWNILVHRLFHRRSMAKADLVVTISDTVAGEIKAAFPELSPKVQRIYCGVDPRYRARDKRSAREYVAKNYQIDGDYLLAVATLEPRKNLALLIKAFAGFKSQNPALHVKLAVVGAKGWKYPSLFHTVHSLGLESSIIFLGYVPDEDLPYLYSAASLFLFPSVYEGFGLPILEAAMSKTPLMLSDIPVFREIAGSAAVYFDPRNARQLAEKISAWFAKPDINNRLAADLAKYSWKKTAAEYLDIFNGGQAKC